VSYSNHIGEYIFAILSNLLDIVLSASTLLQLTRVTTSPVLPYDKWKHLYAFFRHGTLTGWVIYCPPISWQ